MKSIRLRASLFHQMVECKFWREIECSISKTYKRRKKIKNSKMHLMLWSHSTLSIIFLFFFLFFSVFGFYHYRKSLTGFLDLECTCKWVHLFLIWKDLSLELKETVHWNTWTRSMLYKVYICCCSWLSVFPEAMM